MTCHLFLFISVQTETKKCCSAAAQFATSSGSTSPAQDLQRPQRGTGFVVKIAKMSGATYTAGVMKDWVVKWWNASWAVTAKNTNGTTWNASYRLKGLVQWVRLLGYYKHTVMLYIIDWRM